jgi:aspartate carbamoyltransferase catalytic subunit
MRNLLSINDLTSSKALELLDTAAELKKLTSGANKKLPTLRGRTVANLFFEDSTRTRLSFETAAKRLSADVINFSAKGSSVSKGESLKDTAQTLEAMGVDLFVLRHPASGAAHRLAESGWVNAHIVNAGDGTHEHPTQALLDAFTIRKHFGIGRSDFAGLKIAIVGDITHSRVARSNILLLQKLGAEVTVIAPPTLMPAGIESWRVLYTFDFDSSLASFDVVMMLRVQLERMNDAYFPNGREYSKGYGLGEDRLRRMKAGAIVMHPGPMNRGLEISAVSANSERSVVLEQVANGVTVRMAVLYHSLGGPELLSHGGAS